MNNTPRKLPRKLRRAGSKNVLIKQAEMSAEILRAESATASRALFFHAAYAAAHGQLAPGYLQAIEDEVKRTAGQRNLTSKEFFEKCYQAAMVALREGVLAVKPSEEPA